jgi:oxygen-independent coproporphyrinogen III oxidase
VNGTSAPLHSDEAAIGGRGPRGTALYLHFPFCAAKCTYCDFFSLPAGGQDLTGALAALLQEAQKRAPEQPRTVFLGGGTPSLYGTKELVQFLERLEDFTGFRGSAREVTIECNPESIDEHKAAALLAAGVDRFSVGVQSLRPEILTWFGRVHSAEQGLRALAAIRRAGAQRLSADLIYAFPGQEVDAWRTDLGAVLATGLTHLSAYNLTFEEGTALYRQQAQGRAAPLDEELELRLFETTQTLCQAHGLEAYEISNYARPGQASLHNLVYWANLDYVGVGPSAVSRIGGARFGNPRSLGAWQAAIQAQRPAATWVERPADSQRLGESWWLGLRRRQGVDPAEALAASSVPHDSPAARAAQRQANQLVEQGLLELDQGRFRLTVRGWPLADAVARRFLDPLTSDA